jgi:NTE family protein
MRTENRPPPTLGASANGRRRPGRTAFVFAGGAALASIQVGMLRAVTAAGIEPDLITGASSGALNGAMFAAEPASALMRLEELWTGARRRQILPVHPRTLAGALAGRTPHVSRSSGIRDAIQRHLPLRRIEAAAVPLHIVCADTDTREKVVLSHGDVVEALVATTAIPGLYPAVEIGGRTLVDGGLAEDPPLGTAVELGATTVYLFPVGWPLGPAPRKGALVRAMDALDWLFWSVARAHLERWAPECDLYVLPSPPITGMQPLSARSATRLIADAERMTRAWLPQARRWPDERAGSPLRAVGTDVPR